MIATTRHAHLISLLLLAIGLVGCSGTPPIAEGWQPQPAQALLKDTQRDQQGRLQVFIHYVPWSSTHASARVTAPGRGPVLWDPGGEYGKDDPTLGRQSDLFLTQPVSLDQWWKWRRDGCGETTMVVYEWDLPSDEARQLIQVLEDHRVAADRASHFQTRTLAGACSLNISQFLQSYVQSRIDLRKRYFWPHALARRLRHQNPSRVLVWKAPRQVVAYHPPATQLVLRVP